MSRQRGVAGCFEHVGLLTNVSKIKMMVCVLGRIRTCQTWETYNNRMDGNANLGQWRHQRVECNVCGKDLTGTLLQLHLKTQHRIF